MPTKKDLEKEIQALKKKMEEMKDDEATTKNDLQHENQDLKRKLEEKGDELDLARSKLTKLDTLLEKVKEKMECPVCLDIPKKTPVPVCPNGHFVCEKCRTPSCPTCRVKMGQGKSLLAATIVENIDHKCSFSDCGESFSRVDLAMHEIICPHRIVTCPYIKCTLAVSLAKLSNHLINSPQCCFPKKDGVALRILCSGKWNRSNYACEKLVDDQLASWSVGLYRYSNSGEMFVVYPVKKNGQIYFVILMLDSEVECSKFKFELIIHERDSGALESENVVKFQGCPISVDTKREERNIYVASNQLMTKIIKDSNPASFRLSFKLTKRDPI